MKRIFSILSIIVMVLSMVAMIALPAAAEEAELVNLFDLDSAEKGTLSVNTGKITAKDNYRTTDYIAVKPGDTLYFGLNRADLGYQLYLYEDAYADDYTGTRTFKQVASTECSVIESFKMIGSSKDWAIMSYTIPEGWSYVRVTTYAYFAKQYMLTINRPFTNEERMDYFGLVENLYSYQTKTQGYWGKTQTITSSSTAHYATDLIPVAANDKIYFGPCNSTQSSQLFQWDAIGEFTTTTRADHASGLLEITEIFEGGQVIYCYTAATDGYVGINTAAAYDDFFVVTKNEELTIDNYNFYQEASLPESDAYATVTGVAPKLQTSDNVFKNAQKGILQTDKTTIKSSDSHYSGEVFSVSAGDIVYFGPVNLDQSFHGYYWDVNNNVTKFTKAMVTTDKSFRTVATFPNGQAILAYEVTQDKGSLALIDATAHHKYFMATKNVRLTVDNFYEYCDFTSESRGNYGGTLGRYNDVVAKDSILNGKSALFCGDSICAAAADDDFFNDQGLGGWSGRVAMNYGLGFAVNRGVSGAALSSTRDNWQNGANKHSSTGKQQGRIYWQVNREQEYFYDYVILHGGVNDAWDSAPAGEISDSFDIEDFDLSTYAGGLEATFYYATKNHPEAAIGYIINFEAPLKETGNIPNMGEIYFELGKQICDKWNISYLDLYSILNAETFDTSIYTNQTKKDLIHPNSAGYDIIAPYVGDWMETLTPYSQRTAVKHEETVIACVGDSLTKGEVSGDVNRYSYPNYLQDMLGDDYKVLNLGWGGAAAQISAGNAYKKTLQYRQSREADPDVVVIMLGANDVRSTNGWDAADPEASCKKVIAQLKLLVEEYQGLPSNPTVYLATPPYSSNSVRVEAYNNGGYLKAVKALAEEMGLTLIDTYAPTEAKAELLSSDGTHYTADGYKVIAAEVYKALKNVDTAPEVVDIAEYPEVEETDETKPLIRNWKTYYETASAFRIETVEDVEVFGDLIAAGYTFAGKTVYLEKDLDFTGIDFKPLGASAGSSNSNEPSDDEYARSFQGTFDGQNHVFKNVNITSGYYITALFPILKGATIQNFGIASGRIVGYDVVSSIAGYAMYGTKILNTWSAADVYALSHSPSTGMAGIAACIRKNDAAEGAKLVNVAYYGTVTGVSYPCGISSFAESSTQAESIVFGGKIELLYQPSYSYVESSPTKQYSHFTTPFIRFSDKAGYSAAVTGSGGNYFGEENAQMRRIYATDVTPTMLPATAFSSGEVATLLNNSDSTAVWTMKYGYAVPFGDENNAAPIAITKDAVTHYTDYAGKPIGFSLDDGTYWYLNGVLTAAADMPERFTEEVTVGVAVSAAGADFDNDGAITTADAIMLLRYIDKKIPEMNDTLADVNADGKVKIFDAVRLLQVIRDLPQ